MLDIKRPDGTTVSVSGFVILLTALVVSVGVSDIVRSIKEMFKSIL